MKRLVPLVAFALGACVTPTTSATPGLGQVGLVDGLRIRPLAIVEDSRCPIDAVCIWAGRLVVRTEIDGGAGAELVDLTLGTPVDLGEVSVTLVSAEPATSAESPIKPSDYRFTFAAAREP